MNPPVSASAIKAVKSVREQVSPEEWQTRVDLAVCYRCHSEFRGKYARSAAAFDLHTADVLELEYERRTGRR